MCFYMHFHILTMFSGESLRYSSIFSDTCNYGGLRLQISLTSEQTSFIVLGLAILKAQRGIFVFYPDRAKVKEKLDSTLADYVATTR